MAVERADGEHENRGRQRWAGTSGRRGGGSRSRGNSSRQVVDPYRHRGHSLGGDPDREALEADRQQQRDPGDEEHDRGDDARDCDRAGPADRPEVRGPVEADVVDRRGGAVELEHHDRRAPPLADPEADEVGAEEGDPDPERHRPHQRQPVGLDQRFVEQRDVVLDRADRRIQGAGDEVVDALGEARDVVGEGDTPTAATPRSSLAAITALQAITNVAPPASISGPENDQ